MKNLLYYIKKAQREKFAIPQFNFCTSAQIKGIVAAAKALNSPVILGTSEGESTFFGIKQAVAYRDIVRKESGLPIFLNLDHGHFSAQGGPASGWDYVKQAIDAGYDMVHFDGSKLPIEENIKITNQVIKYAKNKAGFLGQKILVEGEIGIIGTDASKLYSDNFEIKEENLTKPEQALYYIKKTGVDLLAVSIGNFHGMSANNVDPNLRLDVLAEIKKIINTPLVLHGGSGTPEKDILEAIKLGIVKININTELRVAYTQALRKFLNENPAEITPYKYLSETILPVQKIAEKIINLFGSNNKI